MSTATTTTTATTKAVMPEQGLLPLTAGFDSPFASSSSSSSAEAALQSLYNRAAQSFLYRDVVLASNLVSEAFTILKPPVAPAPDALDAHRRKWDILRITIESMVYTSPPDRATLPATLRESLLLSPQLFVTTSHVRSLALFAPSSLPRSPTSAFLPHQVLVTHIASSIKVNCPAVGREITESWLSNRGQYDFIPSTGEAYEKVLELYCLHLLPRLEEWDYAEEFLVYEVELPASKRTEFRSTLETMHARKRVESASRTPVVTPITPSRLPSPAPSASSSSSSLSTTSNRTAVPLTRANARPSQLGQPHHSESSISVSSDATLTRQNSGPRSTQHGSPRTNVVRSSANSLVTTTGRTPIALMHIREYIYTYLTTNRLAALMILFLLIPVVSYFIRVRRVRMAPAQASAADQVKRRLLDARGGSVLHRLWSAVGRVIWDTIQMGGSLA